MGPIPTTCQDMRVAELICPQSNQWDVVKIRTILPDYEEQLLLLQPRKRGVEDKHIWLPTPSGEYSAKSRYHSAISGTVNTPNHSSQEEFNWEKEVWNVKCLPKVKFFLWKALRGALPLGENLKGRGINLEAGCPFCGQEESTIHLFFHYNFAQQVWTQAPVKRMLDTSLISSFRKGIELLSKLQCLPPTGIFDGSLGVWIIWYIWKHRNKLLFEKTVASAPAVISQATAQAREWTASHISL
ncbi:PREDICTED: uncharacterized protein LOC104783460 [Camelina sativa]|uniref:Uncharacterized protein LOC104783460 n=1 Tax=Camelina sativa TaxID=90675 RepID=A0ABM0YWJ4_CAMSA|nr:PREDICTED: uncharacterized protein LOC104783460 [Camelina sativa]